LFYWGPSAAAVASFYLYGVGWTGAGLNRLGVNVAGDPPGYAPAVAGLFVDGVEVASGVLDYDGDGWAWI